MKLANINKKRLLDNIKLNENDIESCYSMEQVARAYLYLDEVDKYYFYMNKTIILNDKILQAKEKKRKKKVSNYMKARDYLRKATLLRIVCKDESIKYFQLAKEHYLKALPKKFKDLDLDMDGETIIYLSECCFFLGEYEKCMDFCNYLLPSQKERAIAYYLSDYIQNNRPLEYLDDVIDYIKKSSYGVPIGTNCGCAVSLWDWYEICLQLSHMPSKLDEIQQYVDSLNHSEN